MSANDFISNVTDCLASWDINYTETTDGLHVKSVTLTVSEDEPASTITDGDSLVAITSDAGKAAALLAFPLARRAWDAGYAGDFEVDVHDGMVEMCFSYGSDDLSIYATIDSDLEFTVTDHPLFRENVDMTDLEATLESTRLAYQAPREAWQTICGASDFECDGWEAVVERFCAWACFYRGDRLIKVASSDSDNVALVEDYDPESPIRVIDTDAVTDMSYWAHSDVAAAVLYAIS